MNRYARAVHMKSTYVRKLEYLTQWKARWAWKVFSDEDMDFYMAIYKG